MINSRIDLTGKTFGFLIVQKYAFTKNKSAYWECLCVCGLLKTIRGSHLSSDKIVSCGCQTNQLLSRQNRKYEPHISSARKIFLTNYKDGNLTFEDFLKISSLPCHYCGAPPSNTHNRHIGKTTIKEVIDKGNFTYNGLDRLDSNKLHDLDNVVPCCSTCNYAKLQMSEVEFKNWITRVYNHYILRD